MYSPANKKTQWVELIVQGVSGGNTQNQINFTPQNYLNGMEVLSIETYSVNDVPLSPNQNALPTITQLKSAFLTLYMTDPDKPSDIGQWVYNVPLITLHRVQNGTDAFTRELFRLSRSVISWEKSFISVSPALSNTTNISFLFNVGYQNPVRNC